MKTLIYRFMAFFVAITMIIGCETDSPISEREGQLQTITVAALSGSPDTKVSFTPNEDDALGFKVDWEVGDKLYVSSEDGDTLLATFEIKSDDDIAADGSAQFTLKSATTSLSADTKYHFSHISGERSGMSYNETLAADSYTLDEYLCEAADEYGELFAVLYSATPTTIDKPITLLHLFSFVELTVDVEDISKACVRFTYTDSATDTEYVRECGLRYWKGLQDGSYTFNFPIYPATLSAETPVTVEISVDNCETYTTYLSKAVDGEFEAGKHYRIKKTAVVRPPLAGFPSDAVPVVVYRKNTTIIMAPIPASGIDDIDVISGGVFCIGYSKNGTGYNTKYKVYEDVTWTTMVTRDQYLLLNPNGNGGLGLDVLKLPATEKSITIIAKAPNGERRTFDVTLKGDAPTSVALNRDIFVANIGAQLTLSATVLPNSSTTNKNLKWSSSDTAVAIVNTSGKVTTIGAGSATITATAAVGGKEASCIVRVNNAKNISSYRVGDYYPNSTNPIGVVFWINAPYVGASASSGKIVALDEFTAAFTTKDDVDVDTEGSNGYNNMRAYYQDDSDFSDYPALQWVAEKNEVGYTYPSGAKGQWYLASDEELRHLMSGMCDLIMIAYNAPLYDGFINDWGRNYYMSRDDRSYTPDLTSFNKKITDKGGKAISSGCILSSTLDGSTIYTLNSGNGRVGGSNRKYESAKVRAIMAF